MTELIPTFLVLSSVSYVFPLPLSSRRNNTSSDGSNPEYGEYFEGDMNLNEDQLEAVWLSHSRNGLIDEKYRWRNKTIPYALCSNHTDAQNRQIRSALEAIESVSCLKFVNRTNETNYIQLQADDTGCYSHVGFQQGAQIVNLKKYDPGFGCFRNGTIIHEFLHALGFYHMQSSHDRDEYVKIMWTHIKPGHEHNFHKYNSSLISHFNETYDYSSVMHYGSHAFSKDGNATIVPVNDLFIDVIGQRSTLSQADIVKLNKMYECGKGIEVRKNRDVQ